jgi:hypothetical protein
MWQMSASGWFALFYSRCTHSVVVGPNNALCQLSGKGSGSGLPMLYRRDSRETSE